jgi:hypothetical protein
VGPRAGPVAGGFWALHQMVYSVGCHSINQGKEHESEAAIAGPWQAFQLVYELRRPHLWLGDGRFNLIVLNII